MLPTSSEEYTVHLFVCDTLADWEYGYAATAINNPGPTHPAKKHRIVTVGLQKKPVTTAGGITMLPTMALSEVSPSESAMLILPGADTWDEGLNEEAVQKAQEFLSAGVPVAAICGATAALARSGILDEKTHTSNAPEYLNMTGYKGASCYLNEPAVTDGNLITASGLAPLDFGYHIIKKLGVYKPEVTEAWYGLYKTGDPSYYYALMNVS